MKTMTELETLRDARGYELKLFNPSRLSFHCKYRPEDIPTMYEAIKNCMREEGYFTIQISPLLDESEWPKKPMTMAEWAAAGHTLD